MSTPTTQMPPAHPQSHADRLPLIEVQGTHRQIGCQIGEACAPQIRHSVANARALIASAYETLCLTWEGAQIQASKYIPFAQERYPQYLEEMMGIAEGSGVEFEDITVLNALEAVTMDALHLTKCTSFAVNQDRSANGHVMIAHNEDWLPEDESDVFILRAKPNQGPPYLAMTYGGLLPNIGVNAYGISQACDSVYPSDCRIGIPRLVASRAVLDSATPADAIRHMLAPQRAAGYNHLLAHESGELYNIEVSARRFAVLYGEDGTLVHTNHYLDPQMQAVEKDPDELVATRVRYFRARRLLNQTQLHTMESLKAIQSDHVNFYDSICNHEVTDDHPLDREKTITSLLIDLTERQIHATWGNPCQSTSYTYQL